MSAGIWGGQKKPLDPLELESKVIGNSQPHSGAGNWTWFFWKSSKFLTSQPVLQATPAPYPHFLLVYHPVVYSFKGPRIIFLILGKSLPLFCWAPPVFLQTERQQRAWRWPSATQSGCCVCDPHSSLLPFSPLLSPACPWFLGKASPRCIRPWFLSSLSPLHQSLPVPGSWVSSLPVHQSLSVPGSWVRSLLYRPLPISGSYINSLPSSSAPACPWYLGKSSASPSAPGS